MSFLSARYASLFAALLAVGLGAACTSTTIVPGLVPASDDADAPPATTEDDGAVDAEAAVDAAVAPIGTLVVKGDVSVPGDLGSHPSCSTVCSKIFGTCDSKSSGQDDYTCPNGTNGGQDYDCSRPPDLRTPSNCTLVSYSCTCHDVPLANPYVAVDEADLPVTCSAACASQGLTCDVAKPSVQYQGPALSGGTAAIACGDDPVAAAKSLRCYCR